ncbi:MAG: UDP-2,3-diacylglucosamine diphosphatase LpxI [Deltaproteobacteria bacterium]|nr:UDP-2,3-diacylglucosamine diphosphatase LpxI [Deltaproteobacteria bacterium]
MTTRTLGIIAGGGQLPVIAARGARRQGFRVVVSAIAETRSTFPKKGAARLEFVSLGRPGQTLSFFREEGVTDVVFAGKVDKSLNFANLDFDDVAMAMIARLPGRADMNIAAVLIDELTSRGFHVRAQTDFLAELVAPAGRIAGPEDGAPEREKRIGLEVASALAAHDVGQTVVLRDGAVIALEAFEHTDATIKRAARLAGGDLVVVKMARPRQDLRFDVPAVGPQTVKLLSAAGAKALYVEAGKTLLIDRRKLEKLANTAGLMIEGVERPASVE